MPVSSRLPRALARFPQRWVRAATVVVTVLFALLFVGLIVQLCRVGALEGGWRARKLYPEDGQLLLRLLVNHYSVRIVSRSGDTVAPLFLLLLGGWLSLRSRNPLPLLKVGLALLVELVLLTVGKGYLGEVIGVDELDWHSSALSGPGTTVVVVGGMTCLLLRGRVERATARTVGWLAVSVALAVAGTQLYMGHEMFEVVASLVLGIGVVLVMATASRFWPTWQPRTKR